MTLPWYTLGNSYIDERTAMRRCIITGMLLCMLCSYAHGAVVRDANLEDLCSGAGKIFWGRCTGAETLGTDLVYTFAAYRVLKGGSGVTVTLRMHKAASMYARAPQFAEGQEVLLFLHPESDRGYSSPVGFGQGVFTVAEQGGKKTALNERGNRHLFRGMNMERLHVGSALPGIRQCSLDGGGAVPHQELMDVISDFITKKR
jgi:hypothetical protein